MTGAGVFGCPLVVEAASIFSKRVSADVCEILVEFQQLLAAFLEGIVHLGRASFDAKVPVPPKGVDPLFQYPSAWIWGSVLMVQGVFFLVRGGQ